MSTLETERVTPSNGDISAEYLNTLRSAIDSKEDDIMDLNINITTHLNLLDAAITRHATLNNSGSNQVFSHQISGSDSKPVTNQRSTGTCWLYATLNILRQPFMAKYNLNAFQFNVEYLFFWHKYELCNFWLESIISTRHLPLHSHLVQYLLSKGCEDGSQFDSALNLIEKYGVLPAVCNDNTLYGIDNEVAVKKASRTMNRVLNRKLREFAMNLRSGSGVASSSDSGADADSASNSELMELRKMKKQQMSEVHRILVICFGKPIDRFDWKYRDHQSKELQCHRDLTPKGFYDEFVRPCYDLNGLISLVHDPRNTFSKLMTVEHYGNVIGGKRPQIQYINVPMKEMKEYTIKMLKEDTPCWFACDVRQFYYPKFGSLDAEQFDFKGLLGVDVVNGMTKRERLEYGASINSHSMVLVGYNEMEKSVVQWRVENSWGDKKGNKGYVMMTDEWFDQFVYQVVVEKSMLPQKLLDLLETEPIKLSRWDPFAQ